MQENITKLQVYLAFGQNVCVLVTSELVKITKEILVNRALLLIRCHYQSQAYVGAFLNNYNFLLAFNWMGAAI
jgi:hypothetical protein